MDLMLCKETNRKESTRDARNNQFQVSIYAPVCVCASELATVPNDIVNSPVSPYVTAIPPPPPPNGGKFKTLPCVAKRLFIFEDAEVSAMVGPADRKFAVYSSCTSSASSSSFFAVVVVVGVRQRYQYTYKSRAHISPRTRPTSNSFPRSSSGAGGRHLTHTCTRVFGLRTCQIVSIAHFTHTHARTHARHAKLPPHDDELHRWGCRFRNAMRDVSPWTGMPQHWRVTGNHTTHCSGRHSVAAAAAAAAVAAAYRRTGN